MIQREKRFYDFGPFRVDINSRLLLRDRQMVPLTPKAFDTLLALIERRGELVERQELIRAVWPDVHVEQGSLNTNIFMLRRALGDEAGQEYIVTVPRRGYRFVAGVFERQSSPSVPQSAIRSFAVLPFKLLYSRADGEHLELGLVDALITRLSTLPQVEVRSTSAISRYRDAHSDPLIAGSELGVEFVVTGSIQCCGERIRVTVQILRVNDGATIWAEKFDESLTDFFTIEDAVSARVADIVKVRLSEEESEPWAGNHSGSAEACQLYLQGHFFWNQRTSEGLKKAIEWFNRAIEVDRNYALAYVGLAESYALLGCVHSAMPPKEAMPKAKSAALKALELNGHLVEAYAVMGLVNSLYDWDWLSAERAFGRALELNPLHITARHWHGLFLGWMGRLEEAIAELERAKQLDPFSPIISANVGWAFYAARRYEEAIDQCYETIEMQPNFYRAHVYLGCALIEIGDFDSAIAELELSSRLTGFGPEATYLGYALGRAGRRQEALRLIHDLRERSLYQYVSPYDIALIYAGLNETDQALDWLDRAFNDRTHWLVFLKVEPKFDFLRENARFHRLLERIRLP